MLTTIGSCGVIEICPNGSGRILRLLQQLRQLGDAVRDLSRLILSHEIRRSAPGRLRLEIDVSHGKVIGVADDDAAIFLGGPW